MGERKKCDRKKCECGLAMPPMVGSAQDGMDGDTYECRCGREWMKVYPLAQGPKWKLVGGGNG